MLDMRDRAKWAQRILVGSLAAFCLLGLLTLAPAGAQEDCYPDGCGSPANPPPRANVSCELSAEVAAPGDQRTAVVRGAGGGRVRVFFDGTQVAIHKAGNVEVRRIDFIVPDVPSGRYSVVAVGATFSADCGTMVVGGAEVLSESLTRSRQGSGGIGFGPLAFTGFELLLLVAAIATLIVVGWRLTSAAKRRRVAHR